MKTIRKFSFPVLTLLSCVASPAFAQSGGEANAAVEATAILAASPNPLTVTGVQNISFGEVTIPYSPNNICNYRLHAAANRMDVTRNNDATTPASTLTTAGCGTGNVSHSFGTIAMTCQPRVYLGYSAVFVPANIPGITAEFGNFSDPNAINTEYVRWTSNPFTPDQCHETTGQASVRIGGLLRVTSDAAPSAGPTTIGLLQVTLNYR